MGEGDQVSEINSSCGTFPRDASAFRRTLTAKLKHCSFNFTRDVFTVVSFI